MRFRFYRMRIGILEQVARFLRLLDFSGLRSVIFQSTALNRHHKHLAMLRILLAAFRVDIHPVLRERNFCSQLVLRRLLDGNGLRQVRVPDNKALLVFLDKVRTGLERGIIQGDRRGKLHLLYTFLDFLFQHFGQVI